MIWVLDLFVQKREDHLQLGFMGFGKLGGTITQHPLKGGHEVIERRPGSETD